MRIAPHLAPELARTLSERGLIATAPLALAGMPGARLRARLALDGDLLLAIETGPTQVGSAADAAAIGALLARAPAGLEVAAAALFAELATREAALASELRRLGRWLQLPAWLVLLAALAPLLRDLALGIVPPLSAAAIGLARALVLAAAVRTGLRWLVRRGARRLLGQVW